MDSPTTHASWNFRRSTTGVKLLTDLAAEHGMALADALHGTGITPAQLDDPKGEVDATAELALISNMVRQLSHVPALGLQAGSRYRLTSYGIWGYALISSPNLRSASQLALRYLNLTYAFTHITLEVHQGLAMFTLNDLEVPAAVRRFVVERDAAGLMAIARDLHPAPFPIVSLTFKDSMPGYVEQVAAHYGLQPSYKAAFNRATFPADVLDAPLPQANEHTATLCEDMCRELVNQRSARNGMAALVRNRLINTPAQLPDMEQVAADLCMTSRTLRRHLVSEGTSFRELTDEVRAILAIELMSTARLGHKEIAQRLGFHDLSAFIQAFKRWKGVTPSAYRQDELNLTPRISRADQLRK
jgi:AraC-like DNA-binding protein